MPVIINGTTGITNVNGSASTPAETGTDTDTGIEKTERVPTGTTTKSVKYSVFVPMLIKAIQEQQSLIASQSETINSLTARIVALESK